MNSFQDEAQITELRIDFSTLKNYCEIGELSSLFIEKFHR